LSAQRMQADAADSTDAPSRCRHEIGRCLMPTVPIPSEYICS
jgi:hypothetical protein